MHKIETSLYQVSQIRFQLVESDDFLARYAIGYKWPPFHAACLILGLKPPERKVDGKVLVGVYQGSLIDNTDIDAFDPINNELAEHILDIAKSLRQQWPKASPVAADVIRWALEKGLIDDSPFTRTVLGTVPESSLRDEIERLRGENDRLESDRKNALDGRGKHFEAKRLAILGFAIKELVLQSEKSSALLRRNEVNATALASHLDEQRDELGIPPENESGFSFSTIETSLRNAFSAAKCHTKNAVKNTDKN